MIHFHPLRRRSPGTVAVALAAATARLAGAGVEGARRDARLLFGAAAGLTHEAMVADPARALDPAAARRFAALVDRRAAREPVARILGRRAFWTLELALGPDTLDPRPDSEAVVEAALAHAAEARWIVDLGTGSGCLLLAVLAERPTAWGLGVDRSEGAVATAAGNARRNGLADRARFVVADWGDGIAGGFDVVLCNPPYVRRADIPGLAPEVARFDPPAALDGGPDGLDAIRAAAPAIARLLGRGGVAVVEVGAGQADAAEAIFRHDRLAPAGRRRDLGGVDRALVLRRAAG